MYIKLDTSGYFCRQKRRLRAARRDLASSVENSLKKWQKCSLKSRRSLKEHHDRLMKELIKCQDRIEALIQNAKEVRNLDAVESGISRVMASRSG